MIAVILQQELLRQQDDQIKLKYLFLQGIKMFHFWFSQFFSLKKMYIIFSERI